MPAAAPGDRAFNTDSSAEAQALFKARAMELEALLTDRQQQVEAAMQQYEATGVSEEYHAKELRWKTKAQEVREHHLHAAAVAGAERRDRSGHVASRR